MGYSPRKHHHTSYLRQAAEHDTFHGGAKKCAFLSTVDIMRCRRSENKRMACALARRVAAPSVLSMLYTRTCHRSEPRVAISLFMTFSASMICVCWHGHVLETFRDGTHFACPEADGMHRNDLQHIIATKKSSTSLTSTCKCQRACMLGGGLAPNRTQRLST